MNSYGEKMVLLVLVALAAQHHTLARHTMSAGGCGNNCSSCPTKPACSNKDTCAWADNKCQKKVTSHLPSVSPSPVVSLPSSPVVAQSPQVAASNAQPSLLTAPGASSAPQATSSPSPSTLPASEASDCIPVEGMSSDFENTDWTPFVLKQSDPATGMMVAHAPEAAATGKYGATVTVTRPGTALWHVQLSSAPAELLADQLYTLKFTVKSNKPSSMQVALVQDDTWQVFYVEAPQTTLGFKTTTVRNLAAPQTGRYLLNFDLGLAAQGTHFALDDIMVCKQAAKIIFSNANQATTAMLRTDTSTDFEAGGATKFRAQVTAPAKATAVLNKQGSGAAYNGTSAAAFTVATPGAEPWLVQLIGPNVALSASKTYNVQLALKQKVTGNSQAVNAVHVSWVQPEVWIPTTVATITPTSEYVVHILPAVKPPFDGLYYLTVDMGTAAAGTTVYVDDVKVFEV